MQFYESLSIRREKQVRINLKCSVINEIKEKTLRNQGPYEEGQTIKNDIAVDCQFLCVLNSNVPY